VEEHQPRLLVGQVHVVGSLHIRLVGLFRITMDPSTMENLIPPVCDFLNVRLVGPVDEVV
jgi:hypothetical protein